MTNSFSFEEAGGGDLDQFNQRRSENRVTELAGTGKKIGTKYQHSGKAPLESLLFSVVVGLICSAGSGVLYSFGVSNVEMILVELVFLLMFAGGVGLPIGLVARKFKMRSDGHMFLVVVLAASLGLYCCWAVHPYFAIGGDIAWSPGEIYQWAILLYQKGEFGGWLAIGVWVGEIIAVYFMGLGFAFVQVEQPFCESCDCWTEKREAVACFGHPGVGTGIARRLAEKDYLALLECAPSNERASYYLKVDMDMCPQCLETCTLTCKEITNSINAKGEKEQKEKVLFDKWVVQQSELQEIIAAGYTDEIDFSRQSES